ncbi:MAG TPA: cyclase family protein [Solirubrobacterales bacterium]|nr:cyclase family protein [Solirubrobacterales bacterium]
MTEPADIEVSADEFRQLFDRVSNWGRWGADDERGALNFLTPGLVAAAAGLVRIGRTVSLSRSLKTEREPDNPEPADHRMTMLGGREHPQGLAFAKDYIGVDYHNDSHSHLDALCHVSYDDSLYNGRPADSVSATGASVETVEVLKEGLVGRGVLLDVPRTRGVNWLEPGESVLPGDLEESESRQGVTVGEGDILLIRTGHASRLDELGPWDTASLKAGLHPSCAEFLAERCIAALGSDGNSDTAPSLTEGVGFPIHVLALTAMGVHLLDYLHLRELSGTCEEAGRWEFLFVGAPLRIAGGTGSPLNPIAIL